MKTKLFLICSALFGSVIAAEPEGPFVLSEKIPEQLEQQFGYFSLGVGPLPIPLPVFALGYRTQIGHHGFDGSFQVTTVIEATQLKTNLLYHYYFKPSVVSQFYVGGGVGPSLLIQNYRHDRCKFLISPEFVLGQQYLNKSKDIRFMQAQISFPTVYVPKGKVFYGPLVVLSYGFGF